MLIRFNVANFLSFDKETEFNVLTATSLKTHKDHVYNINKNIRVLKTSVIYGANGSGKSNLIKAISLLKQIIINQTVPINISKKKFRFKENNSNNPIKLEIELSTNNSILTYGIVFNDNFIFNEYLYRTGVRQAKLVFNREYSNQNDHTVISFGEDIKQILGLKLNDSILEETDYPESNALLLSKNDILKIKEIDDIKDWVKNQLLVLDKDPITLDFSKNLYLNDTCLNFSNKILKALNIGIESIEVDSQELSMIAKQNDFIKHNIDEIKLRLDNKENCYINNENFIGIALKENNQYIIKRLLISHQSNNSKVIFELSDESEGIKRLLSLIPFLNNIMENNNVYIIDKLGHHLHPVVLHAIIKTILSLQPNSQIIFTTHDSSLLNTKLLRTDEIWFTEKDFETQSTRLYTLDEFKPRAELDIEKGYLNGRFGAIPFTAKLQDLNWE